MIIGIPKEIKPQEHRVGMTPGGVKALVGDGHTVVVENGAGSGSGFTDEQYRAAGADLLRASEDVWGRAALVVKVKEPLPAEYGFLRSDLTLFTYLHLAAVPELARALVSSGCTALGYETLEVNGRLPLLEPMSEIAGRMAPVMGAYYLQRHRGGRGVLVPGVPGVAPAKVLVLGAGTVGTNSAEVAIGMGAQVTVINRNRDRLQDLEHRFGAAVVTLDATEENIAREVPLSDMVIGAVLVPGGKAPKLVTEDMVRAMAEGSVIVDVSVDQGGCIATTRPTTHDDPVYAVHGVTHYCVANMPGAYPRTSTIALTDATLTYIRSLADQGVDGATEAGSVPASAVNVRGGRIVHDVVADALKSL